MAKKKSATTKLAEVVTEIGIDKAQDLFEFLKSLNQPKKDMKPRVVKEKGASA